MVSWPFFSYPCVPHRMLRRTSSQLQTMFRRRASELVDPKNAVAVSINGTDSDKDGDNDGNKPRSLSEGSDGSAAGGKKKEETPVARRKRLLRKRMESLPVEIFLMALTFLALYGSDIALASCTAECDVGVGWTSFFTMLARHFVEMKMFENCTRR